MKEILVISTGLAPQVITEMLWWLAARDEDEAVRIVPDGIHIVTTRKGAEVIDAQVRGAKGRLKMFCEEFGLPDLDERLHVHVPAETDPEYGDDARDLDTNIGFANRVTHLLRDLTADPETRVRACLAGGRKTMSFYMGYAMSLLGRSDDDLCHVLVTPAFENSPDFWWKPKVPRTLRVGGSGQQQDLSTDEATIAVASIPFVRLRYLMDPIVFDDPHADVDFGKFIIGAQAGVERQRVILTDSLREIRIGNQAVILPPKKYSLYRLLAEVRLEGRTGAGPDGVGPDHSGWLTLHDVLPSGRPDDGPFSPVVERFLQIYEDLPESRIATKGRSMRDTYADMELSDIPTEFNREISNTNRTYLSRFNDYITEKRVRIHRARGVRKLGTPARFGLAFEPNQIEIVSDPM